MSIRMWLVSVVLAGAAAGCGSSYSSPAPTPTPTPSTNQGGGAGTPVSIVSGAQSKRDTAYAPNPISVAVGGSVTWKNDDNIPHTATDDNGAWNSGSIAPGQTFTQSFPAAGSFKYHCAIHPGMVGTVTVQ